MNQRRGWNIHTCTQLISVGPALLLTGFLTHPPAGPAPGARSYRPLESLLRATLGPPDVRFAEVRDRDDNILVYVERPKEQGHSTPQVEVFQAPTRLQGQPAHTQALPPLGKSLGDGYLGRVVVGMSNDTLNTRQQEILFKAGVLSLFALLLTFLLARTLAERMGGTLCAESQLDTGSVFTLEIPLPFLAHNEPVQSSDTQNLGSGEGQSVLLVEDNPVNQTVIEAMLRSLGYQISQVGDGQQAVQNCRAQDYAALLMDCRLPLIDGYEATRQIRQLEADNNCPSSPSPPMPCRATAKPAWPPE